MDFGCSIEFSWGQDGRYIRLYLLIQSFDLILRKAFSTFLSVVFVGSLFSFWNCSVRIE